MSRAALTYAPRLLPAPEAARYLGISETKLRSLPIPRRVSGGNRLFDRYDLDSYASGLPYEGDGDDEVAACDRAFGITG